MISRIPLFLALLLMMTACSQQSHLDNEPMPPRVAQWSGELHYRLNDFRAQHGKPPLQHHDGLEQLCLNHSGWLRDNRGTSMHHGRDVSHLGSEWRSLVARTEYGMAAYDENVAFTGRMPQNVARHMMVLWRASPPHREAMLGDWSHSANAMRVDEDGAIFVTMNFGRWAPEPNP